MPRFSINVSMMLNEYPFLERFSAAADLGFGGVDIQFPYEFPAAEIARAARGAGVEVVLFNLPAGDLPRGGRGLACAPERRTEFQRAVDEALPYLEALGNRRLNILAGRVDNRRERQAHIDVLVANIEYASSAYAHLELNIMIEPVNGFDVPGYLLQTASQAMEVIGSSDVDGLAIQYDIYHQHRMGRDVLADLQACLPRIAHIQFADAPGRHEPGTGEIDFDTLFNRIDELGYRGWVGAEYLPSGPTRDTLHWFPGQQASTERAASDPGSGLTGCDNE